LAQRVGLIPPGVAPTPEEIRRGPTFTPFTVMPELANREEVRAALVKEYPPELKAAGKGGTVMTWALVGENGAVEQSLVKKSSDDARLDSAAVRVVRSMRFTPAQNAGKPALVWVMLPIIFRTDAQEAQARTQVNAEYAGLPPADSKYGIPGLPEGYTPPQLVNGREITMEFRGAFPQGAQVQHWAWVHVNIAADGTASDFTLFKSSGNAQVDALVLTVARKLRFAPALDASGHPAAVPGYLPFPMPSPPESARPPAPGDSGSPRADAGKRPNVAALVAPLAATVVVHK
ncbi:MAG TPA: TonB family protein, partial [Longimicrobiales bacterium]